MVEARIDAFLATDRRGECAPQQVAAVAVGFVEGTTELETVEQLRTDPLMKQQIEGFVGKKLWGERQGTIGKPQAVEDHPGNRFARSDLFLVLHKQTRVDHLDETSVLDRRSDYASVV